MIRRLTIGASVLGSFLAESTSVLKVVSYATDDGPGLIYLRTYAIVGGSRLAMVLLILINMVRRFSTAFATRLLANVWCLDLSLCLSILCLAGFVRREM